MDKDNFSDIFKQKELTEEVGVPRLLENPRFNTFNPSNNFKNQESEKYPGTHSSSAHQNVFKNAFHSVKARTVTSQTPSTNPVSWSDSEKCTALYPVEVLVSNLDYNISPREWKEILSSTFRTAIMVRFS